MDELYLVYINKIGSNWVGEYIYEFLFSNSKEVDGDDWDAYPASGQPSPPDKSYIKSVGKLKTEMVFNLVQESDTFAVWDSVDGVVALAWENVFDYDVYPDTILHFHFGITKENVDDMLYTKDLVLNYEVKEKIKK